MNPMFWWAVGGLIVGSILLLAVLVLLQLSARCTYVPGDRGTYAVSGNTESGLRFVGSANVTDAHDHVGAAWSIRAWMFRRGAKVDKITHIASGKVIYQRD